MFNLILLISDIGDVDDHSPGLLDEIREFYRMYETPEGRPPTDFVFSGEFRDRVNTAIYYHNHDFC